MTALVEGYSDAIEYVEVEYLTSSELRPFGAGVTYNLTQNSVRSRKSKETTFKFYRRCAVWVATAPKTITSKHRYPADLNLHSYQRLNHCQRRVEGPRPHSRQTLGVAHDSRECRVRCRSGGDGREMTKRGRIEMVKSVEQYGLEPRIGWHILVYITASSKSSNHSGTTVYARGSK